MDCRMAKLAAMKHIAAPHVAFADSGDRAPVVRVGGGAREQQRIVGAVSVGRGFFLSTIVAESGDTLFLLPPRYRGHEEEIVRAYGFAGGVREAGLHKAWSAMKELFGGPPAKSPLA